MRTAKKQLNGFAVARLATYHELRYDVRTRTGIYDCARPVDTHVPCEDIAMAAMYRMHSDAAKCTAVWPRECALEIR